MMFSDTFRLVAIAIGVAIGSATILAASTETATAADCFGCYDDKNGNEKCTTVQVNGRCTVATFCAAVKNGCGGSSSSPSPVRNLTLKPSTGTGQPAARPVGRLSN